MVAWIFLVQLTEPIAVGLVAVKFIFTGFSKRRLFLELGNPKIKEKLPDGREKWTYLTSSIARKVPGRSSSPMGNKNISKLVKSRKDAAIFGETIFIIEDGKIVKIF